MNNNVIVSITCAKVRRIWQFPHFCYRLFGLFKSLFDLHQKKLTMPFGTANLSEIGHRCNLRALDQQQQVPYQPRCPRTS